ncbi:MAG: DUF4912 domain-containing protein [Treponema sp.]|nr:DUF4912 domain-containing protein [Treponema sp.]
MNSEKLDSLSLEELYALADKMELDLPTGLERLFVMEEILDAAEEDSEDRRSSIDEALLVEEKKYSGSESDNLELRIGVPPQLEQRYNETMIRALVRDPSWAFAYWDLSDAEKSSMVGDESASPLFLRVVELDREGGDLKHGHFDIPVSPEDLQWYINLPRSGIRFRIDLCSRRGGGSGTRIRILARSNPVDSPRQELHPGSEGIDQAGLRLLQLSGIGDMRIHTQTSDNPIRIITSGMELQPGDSD